MQFVAAKRSSVLLITPEESKIKHDDNDSENRSHAEPQKPNSWGDELADSDVVDSNSGGLGSVLDTVSSAASDHTSKM